MTDIDNTPELAWVGTRESRPMPRWGLVEMAVLLAAVIGRLPALGAWWTLDDWGLLGRAAGILNEQAAVFPARFISQHLWWDLTWPLFGLNSDAHALSRLLLHGLAAVLLTRIGARLGLGSLARLVAGLLLAATPLAFTPLYWAAGIQELLAAVLALLAVDRWLAGGRRNLWLAALMAVLAMFSKESALGLPVLFMALLWSTNQPRREERQFGWALCLLLLPFMITEIVLVMNHFATGPGDPYALGGLSVVGANLGIFGWWLASPGPVLAGSLNWPMATAGSLLFLAWGVWGWVRARHGIWLPLMTLLAALLSLGPALALQGQVHPYLAYLAVAPLALALASLLPSRRTIPRYVMALLTLLAMTWGFFGMRGRLEQRGAGGLPADPVVSATSLSWKISKMLPGLPVGQPDQPTQAVTFLQFPVTGKEAQAADRLGDRWVAGTRLYEAIGGAVGPRLILGRDIRIDWVNALYTNPSDALVLCEYGPGFKHWGTTANATLYAALTDVGTGRFERARKHFARAGGLHEDTIGFTWDPHQMVIPLDDVLARKESFVDWTLGLLENGGSPVEVGGMQEMFFNLLSVCTGQPVSELTGGSKLLLGQETTTGPVPVPKGD